MYEPTKIAYISGLLSNGDTLDEYERKRNIVKARRVAYKYMKKGYAVICPHLFKFPEDSTEKERLARCINEIHKLDPKKDVIVFVRGWEKSAGASAEHVEAWKCHLKKKYEGRSIAEAKYEMSHDEKS